MDECLALEEHRGSIDWVLDDPDPELGTIEPFLLASRRADVSATVTPTTLPSMIINLQYALGAPAPSGLQGAFNAITNPNVFLTWLGWRPLRPMPRQPSRPQPAWPPTSAIRPPH